MGQRYFLEQSPSADAPEIILSGAEAQHLIKVMRGKPGTAVELFDGSGVEWEARILDVRRNDVTLEVLGSEMVSREPALQLTLGIALPKGDRQKWVIGKLVELGVYQVVPLVTENGVAQPVEKAMGRLRRQVVEASKQCGRNHLMRICEPCTLSVFLEQQFHQAWIAHPLSAEDVSGIQSTTVAALNIESGTAGIAIGPEGGFSVAEVSKAMTAGWEPIELGSRILRIETAAMAVAAQLLLGR
ncbi:MAG: hypothetical protein CMM02_09390 [Rhodopirellula sp.]|jgi:16S rRNA (uracil1498-N3)-methyltransferase|nr:hypothetical protein [Rhodopirellula sp.]